MKKYLIFLVTIGITFTAPAPFCTAGKNFCSKCNQLTNLCIICESEVFKPNAEGGCTGTKKCTMGQNYCETCNEEGTLCETCAKGYYPDENGGCTYTDNCKISYNGECLICLNDFILVGKIDSFKICKSLDLEDFMNCKEIDNITGLCKTCEEEYYLNEGDKKCIKTKNCDYSSFGQCTSCISDYYLDNNDKRKCKNNTKEMEFKHCKESDDSKTCSKCEDGYYMAENGICSSIKFCEFAQEKCETCIEGYYLSENKGSCTNTENCSYGDKDSGICEGCKNKYFLDYEDRKCKSNQKDNDLKYCTIFSGECKSCEEGYYLGEDSKCSNTLSCAESELGICKECSEGFYYGVDSKCSSVKNCIRSNSPDSCTECKDGYYLPKYSKECKVADGIFKNCKVSDYTLAVCEVCKDDYYILPSDHLCYSNKKEGPFYKCGKADNEGKECAECIKGYYLGDIDKKCSTIENCAISEEEDECLECENYYCLNVKNGTCEDNDFIEDEAKKFLYRCKKTNKEGTKCEECAGNYTLENGLCIDEINCEKMENGKCIKCKGEEDNYSFCLNKEFGCVQSYYLHNCIKCNDLSDLDFCTQCQEGYHADTFGQCQKKS